MCCHQGRDQGGGNKAKAVVDALAGMRIRANIFSMGLDFASGFVPGGGALRAGGKFLFDKAIDTVKVVPEPKVFPSASKVASLATMDVEVKSQEDGAWAKPRSTSLVSCRWSANLSGTDGCGRSEVDAAQHRVRAPVSGEGGDGVQLPAHAGGGRSDRGVASYASRTGEHRQQAPPGALPWTSSN